MPTASASRIKLLTRISVTVVLLLAVALDGAQLLRTYMLTEKRVSPDYYIDGQVDRPFAYRALVPCLMRGMNALTPAWMAAHLDHLGKRIAGFGMVGLEIRTGPENKYPRAIVWLAALQLASLIGYAFVGASLAAKLSPGNPGRRLLVAPALLLFLAPIVFRELGHIYDFTVVFFMMCLLRLMASERPVLYLVVFAASCVNKETTIFMMIAYAAVFFRRMPFIRYTLMLAAQFAIFLAIYASLRLVYKDNPGSAVEVHLFDQFAYYGARLHGLFARVLFCAAIVLVVLAVVFRWREKPVFLRRASAMIPPFIAIVLYGAAPGEVRNLYEIVPLVSLLLLCSLASIFSIARQRLAPHAA